MLFRSAGNRCHIIFQINIGYCIFAAKFQHYDSSTKLGLNGTTIRNQQNYNLLLAHINRLIRSHHRTKPPTFFSLGYISRDSTRKGLLYGTGQGAAKRVT